MWHEARKQERLIRGMIVDYRRRAERRKDFYEKIKAEPTQFLQLHGRRCKIHLDPIVAAAGEGPAIMMPWQGDANNMIDRFDVRAHLDYIPEVKTPYIPPDELDAEERQCNYERYRILAQNVFLSISEEKFLQQLAIEEQFGVTIEEKEAQKEKLNEKKGTGVAIGYNYNDPGAQPSSSNGPEIGKVEQIDSDEDSDLEIIDVDLSIDVNKMEAQQAHELNAVGPQFGMAGCDLFSFLTGDADDAEHQKQLLREEKEKAMFSGRKSRRERRAHRDKKLASRVVSPPSYAAPRTQSRSPVARALSNSPSRSHSRSRSRSVSPDPHAAPIQFITSFGGDDDDVKPSSSTKPLYADKLKQNLKRVELYSEIARKVKGRSPASGVRDHRRPRALGPHRPSSRSRSSSRSRPRSVSSSRSRSRYRSRTPKKTRAYSRSGSRSSRSRSRSYSPYRRSSSRPNNYRNRYSRSPTNRTAKYNDARSINFESDKSSPQKPVPRYYGRRKEDKSSSELSVDSSSESSDGEQNKPAVGNRSNSNQNQLRLSGSSSKAPSRETLTLKEKLKKKMQAQLARQLRADKRAEAERVDRENRRQARREEEMRELAIKLRRKQREMRHQQNRRSSEENSDRSHSRSSSRESVPLEKKERARSKSRSPHSIQICETNREPAPFRSKQETGENPRHESMLSRKRNNPSENHYKEDRRPDEDRNESHYTRPDPNRYDRYSKREYPPRSQHNRPDYLGTDRWEKEGEYPGNRRPYVHRGGYRPRGHDYRHYHDHYHGEGSSSWRDDRRQSPDRVDHTRNKIKLVDY